MFPYLSVHYKNITPLFIMEFDKLNVGSDDPYLVSAHSVLDCWET